MSKAHFRQVRKTLYALKRQYPQRIGLYRSEDDATDFETGVQSQTVFKHTINRAILLPTNLTRNFAYDLAYIAVNKDFTHGGFFDHDTRRVVLSKRDIPKGWVLDLNNWLVVKHKRWEIRTIIEFENEEGVMLVLDAISNQPPREIHDGSPCHTLNLTQSVVGTL